MRQDLVFVHVQLVDAFAYSLGELEQQMVHALDTDEDPDRDPDPSLLVQ